MNRTPRTDREDEIGGALGYTRDATVAVEPALAVQPPGAHRDHRLLMWYRSRAGPPWDRPASGDAGAGSRAVIPEERCGQDETGRRHPINAAHPGHNPRTDPPAAMSAEVPRSAARRRASPARSPGRQTTNRSPRRGGSVLFSGTSDHHRAKTFIISEAGSGRP